MLILPKVKNSRRGFIDIISAIVIAVLLVGTATTTYLAQHKQNTRNYARMTVDDDGGESPPDKTSPDSNPDTSSNPDGRSEPPPPPPAVGPDERGNQEPPPPPLPTEPPIDCGSCHGSCGTYNIDDCGRTCQNPACPASPPPTEIPPSEVVQPTSEPRPAAIEITDMSSCMRSAQYSYTDCNNTYGNPAPTTPPSREGIAVEPTQPPDSEAARNAWRMIVPTDIAQREADAKLTEAPQSTSAPQSEAKITPVTIADVLPTPVPQLTVGIAEPTSGPHPTSAPVQIAIAQPTSAPMAATLNIIAPSPKPIIGAEIPEGTTVSSDTTGIQKAHDAMQTWCNDNPTECQQRIAQNDRELLTVGVTVPVIAAAGAAAILTSPYWGPPALAAAGGVATTAGPILYQVGTTMFVVGAGSQAGSNIYQNVVLPRQEYTPEQYASARQAAGYFDAGGKFVANTGVGMAFTGQGLYDVGRFASSVRQSYSPNAGTNTSAADDNYNFVPAAVPTGYPMPKTNPEALAPRVVNEYLTNPSAQLGTRIGDVGGFACAYCRVSPVTGQQEVSKILLTPTDPEALDMLRQEAQTMMTYGGPNSPILQYNGAWIDPKTGNVVGYKMEYGAVQLDRLIQQQGGRMTAEQANSVSSTVYQAQNLIGQPVGDVVRGLQSEIPIQAGTTVLSPGTSLIKNMYITSSGQYKIGDVLPNANIGRLTPAGPVAVRAATIEDERILLDAAIRYHLYGKPLPPNIVNRYYVIPEPKTP